MKRVFRYLRNGILALTLTAAAVKSYHLSEYGSFRNPKYSIIRTDNQSKPFTYSQILSDYEQCLDKRLLDYGNGKEIFLNRCRRIEDTNKTVRDSINFSSINNRFSSLLGYLKNFPKDSLDIISISKSQKRMEEFIDSISALESIEYDLKDRASIDNWFKTTASCLDSEKVCDSTVPNSELIKGNANLIQKMTGKNKPRSLCQIISDNKILLKGASGRFYPFLIISGTYNGENAHKEEYISGALAHETGHALANHHEGRILDFIFNAKKVNAMEEACAFLFEKSSYDFLDDESIKPSIKRNIVKKTFRHCDNFYRDDSRQHHDWGMAVADATAEYFGSYQKAFNYLQETKMSELEPGIIDIIERNRSRYKRIQEKTRKDPFLELFESRNGEIQEIRQDLEEIKQKYYDSIKRFGSQRLDKENEEKDN
ncbi:MAG: hypothetical protein JW716_04120 [Candidatus Aenigmarchaeota archaeon]|nr:hypothetical protein [Candidatus Aenigmarchaeota archaeon]